MDYTFAAPHVCDLCENYVAILFCASCKSNMCPKCFSVARYNQCAYHAVHYPSDVTNIEQIQKLSDSDAQKRKTLETNYRNLVSALEHRNVIEALLEKFNFEWSYYDYTNCKISSCSINNVELTGDQLTFDNILNRVYDSVDAVIKRDYSVFSDDDGDFSNTSWGKVCESVTLAQRGNIQFELAIKFPPYAPLNGAYTMETLVIDADIYELSKL